MKPQGHVLINASCLGKPSSPCLISKPSAVPSVFFSINRWYSCCPHTEWEMKPYGLQHFLRLPPPPHCMRRVLRGERDSLREAQLPAGSCRCPHYEPRAGKWVYAYSPMHPRTHTSIYPSIANQTHLETSDLNKNKLRVSKREQEPMSHDGNVDTLTIHQWEDTRVVCSLGVIAHKTAMNIHIKFWWGHKCASATNAREWLAC